MIAMLRFYLLRAGLRRAPLMAAIPIVGYLVLTQFVGKAWASLGLGQDPDLDEIVLRMSGPPVYMISVMMGLISALQLWMGEEFDLALPVGRKTVFALKNLAALMILAVYAVPVSVMVIVVESARGLSIEATRFFANFTMMWAVLYLMTAPILRAVKRLRPGLLFMIAGATAGVMVAMINLAMDRHVGFGLVAVALPVAVISVLVGMRQAARFELVPASDTRAPRADVTEIELNQSQASDLDVTEGPGLADGFSPFVRVMGRALWFRWWYAPLVLILAGMSIVAFIPESRMLWMLIYTGMLMPMLLKEVIGLLPFVRRQALFRGVLLPIVATAALGAGVIEILTFSPKWLLVGVAAVSGMVFSAWATLPSRAEYARRSRFSARTMIWGVVLVCAFIPTFAGRRGEFWGIVSKQMSERVPWLFGRPVVLSIMLVAITALFWWDAERKFRHYEPNTAQRGLAAAEQ